eukprot:TRINITY_DN49754_c0_g1_i1.p1 TRINITY_DN49754_c0_g1~~TRINITY_DN49754_c0_g1_i1.p1  ORF type:complete len:257 (-),score=49.56 TRINITY_DN49754_c0_g1_i1:84-854(-)
MSMCVSWLVRLRLRYRRVAERSISTMMFLWLTLALAAVVSIRVAVVARRRWRHRGAVTGLTSSSPSLSLASSATEAAAAPPLRTMVVLGSGGHTAEMMSIFDRCDRRVYSPVVYVLAATDATSRVRVEAYEAAKGNADNVVFHAIPRAREVHQSWLSTPLTTLWACAYCVLSVLNFRPAVILVNGPGTCIPMCFAAILLEALGVHSSKIVFVESFCRVKSLSMTGRLLYPLANRFIVQWPQLMVAYPRSEYIGRLC